ncbi:mediator of RNA polymerase II transcription subunit 28-like [Patiria miniata]|uniref:Mediator of RNA polymerase II transcription subunit 28 n=1 Tax=Patiria miniata TaxID=46514 RepID=A0A914B4J1_PATMI|nr:mediator of RNA polymerase II transcription subunit 28-like [Patiria miniata]
MAAPSNDKNLVDEMEAAFQGCFSTLIAQDHLNVVDSQETRTSVEQSIQRFLDVSKELESYFLQRQQMLSVTRPELPIKEEVEELKQELQRKETLIQQHQANIQKWLAVLQQSDGGVPPSPQQQQQQQQAALQQSPRQMGPRAMGFPPHQPVPLSGPLAHLEHAASSIGGNFDRR